MIRAPLGSDFPAEVREVTVTAEAVALLRLILPSVESAAIEAAARLRVVVLPMPVDAASVIVGVVIKPAPLMLPAVLRTETVPDVVVIVLPIVTPADPFSETVPDDVVKVPLVARVPKRDWKSIVPAPVLRLKAEKLRVVPAIAVMPVLAPRVGPASVSAFASVMATVALVEFNVTLPVKSLDLVSVITPAPALKVAAPAPDACVIVPLCVMPTDVTVRVPVPKLDAANLIALESVIATLLAPELFRLTSPVKSLLALPRVITPAPALKVATPAEDACVIAPVWVIPTAFKVRVPLPTLDAARIRSSTSLTATLFAPVFDKVTAPPKSLAASLSVIAKLPALKLEVPVGVTPPLVWVIAPPAVTETFRSVDWRSVGSSYAALV